MFYLKFQKEAPGFWSPQYAEITGSDFDSATNAMIAAIGEYSCLPVRPYILATLYNADPKRPGKDTPITYINVSEQYKTSLELSNEHPLESKVQEDGRFRVQFREFGFVPAYKTNGAYYSFTNAFSTFEEAQSYIETRKFVVQSHEDVQVLHQLIDNFVNDTESFQRGVTKTTSGFPATLTLHVKTPRSVSVIQAKRGEPSWLFVRDTSLPPGPDRLYVDVPAIDYTIEHGTYHKSQPVIENLVVQKREQVRQQLHQELERELRSVNVHFTRG